MAIICKLSQALCVNFEIVSSLEISRSMDTSSKVLIYTYLYYVRTIFIYLSMKLKVPIVTLTYFYRFIFVNSIGLLSDVAKYAMGNCWVSVIFFFLLEIPFIG